jgi:hypothetical protein
MEKHKAFYSRRAFFRILAKAKVLPVQVGDAYLTPENQAAKISHLHETAPDKVDVEIDLHDGNSITKTYSLNDLKPLTPKPTYCATTPHGWPIDVAKSAAHKFMRRGDEGRGCYWIRQLYWTNEEGRCPVDVWKQLHVYAGEDIGPADLTVMNIIDDLEREAIRVKGDENHSDQMMVILAMLICCRAKKSRASDNAIVWYMLNPTYKSPTPEEVEAIAKTDPPKPVIPDDSFIYDKHTAKGRQMGRKGKAGLEHFLKEGARLENESTIPDFQAPVTVADPEKTFPTEGGL